MLKGSAVYQYRVERRFDGKRLRKQLSSTPENKIQHNRSIEYMTFIA